MEPSAKRPKLNPTSKFGGLSSRGAVKQLVGEDIERAGHEASTSSTNDLSTSGRPSLQSSQSRKEAFIIDGHSIPVKNSVDPWPETFRKLSSLRTWVIKRHPEGELHIMLRTSLVERWASVIGGKAPEHVVPVPSDGDVNETVARLAIQKSNEGLWPWIFSQESCADQLQDNTGHDADWLREHLIVPSFTVAGSFIDPQKAAAESTKGAEKAPLDEEDSAGDPYATDATAPATASMLRQPVAKPATKYANSHKAAAKLANNKMPFARPHSVTSLATRPSLQNTFLQSGLQAGLGPSTQALIRPISNIRPCLKLGTANGPRAAAVTPIRIIPMAVIPKVGTPVKQKLAVMTVPKQAKASLPSAKQASSARGSAALGAVGKQLPQARAA